MNEAEASKPRKPPKAPELDDGPHTARWNLAELPSAQHKAGLAGLAICVQYLQRKPDRKGVCEIVSLDPTGLTLRVDRNGMQALFDEVYDAALKEKEYPQPFKNTKTKIEKRPIRTVERTIVDKKGNEKTKTFYVYGQVVPSGGVVDEWDAAQPGTEKLWLKLWRDFVWEVLRSRDTQRSPYKLRANKDLADDGSEAFDVLIHRPNDSLSLASTFYLGAEGVTAENVPFQDRARMKVLLHFWPFAVPIYRPRLIDREGKTKPIGYAVVMPDVEDLEGFVTDWAKLARERGGAPAGYLPREAVVDLAAEAGLDFGHRLLQLVAQREGTAITKPRLLAVDVFHVEKDENSVRIRSVTRVDLERSHVDAYARAKAQYWSRSSCAAGSRTFSKVTISGGMDTDAYAPSRAKH